MKERPHKTSGTLFIGCHAKSIKLFDGKTLMANPQLFMTLHITTIHDSSYYNYS